MKSIYLALWYKCNQKCLGCPVTNNDNRSKSLSASDICAKLASLPMNESIAVTLSGGEPTIHPDFFDILDLLRERNADICILTNAERFSDKGFCDVFLSHVDIFRTTVITTIHASNPQIHEAQNGSVGSFNKSIRGLQYLSFRGIPVTIKHCITAKNYQDTRSFIDFVDDSFHPSVDIQLWGLDYSGLTKDQAKELYSPFSVMRPALEDALDRYLSLSSRNHRLLSLHNLPLCALDPFYWEMMPNTRNDSVAYHEYIDPTTEVQDMEDDCVKGSSKCKECAVSEFCCGAYRSVFEYFGDETVTPVQAVLMD